MNESKRVESAAAGWTSRAVAVSWGLACHAAFFAAVAAMFVGLHEGLGRPGLGQLEGRAALLADAALVLQFPLLHSLFLSRVGRRLLGRLAPMGLGRALSTTTYVLFASLQILVVFLAWSPSGVVWWEASGWTRHVLDGLYVASWLLVVKTMQDAGLSVQMGWLGWLSVARGQPPAYGSFPTGGSFRWCRQPIYLAFALTLWTGAVWTPDRLALALVWTAYCLVGPLLKERRYVELHGERYRAYQASVPYMIPALGRRA